MRQLVYFSTAAAHQCAEMIANILEISRRRNAREGVTGLLVAGGNRFLQVIEGEPAALGATISRIENDVRHSGVQILVDRIVQHRGFESWSMAYHDVPRLGAYATFRTVADAMHDEVDDALKAQVQCFTNTFATTPISPRPSPWPLAIR